MYVNVGGLCVIIPGSVRKVMLSVQWLSLSSKTWDGIQSNSFDAPQSPTDHYSVIVLRELFVGRFVSFRMPTGYKHAPSEHFH